MFDARTLSKCADCVVLYAAPHAACARRSISVMRGPPCLSRFIASSVPENPAPIITTCSAFSGAFCMAGMCGQSWMESTRGPLWARPYATYFHFAELITSSISVSSAGIWPSRISMARPWTMAHACTARARLVVSLVPGVAIASILRRKRPSPC